MAPIWLNWALMAARLALDVGNVVEAKTAIPKIETGLAGGGHGVRPDRSRARGRGRSGRRVREGRRSQPGWARRFRRLRGQQGRSATRKTEPEFVADVVAAIDRPLTCEPEPEPRGIASSTLGGGGGGTRLRPIVEHQAPKSAAFASSSPRRSARSGASGSG